MLNMHFVYVIALVSQLTSALVLALLAWADRRSRWLMPLACACLLHAGAVYLMPLWRGTGRWIPQAISAAILLLMLYLIHIGLRAVMHPAQRRSRRAEAALVGAMLLLAGLAAASSTVCTEATTVAGTVLLLATARMLWQGQIRALRAPLRVTAVLLATIAAHFLLRIPLELWAPGSAALLALRESTILLMTLMAFAFLAIYARESRRRLHEESRVDLLTGLLNRRAMEESAVQALKRAALQGKPCALLLLDLDHFKRLNDTWGHDLGDRALIATGALLLRTAREIRHCKVARMGGEEFAMLLADHTGEAAHARAERLCAELAALRTRAGATEVGCTASIGVSLLQRGETSWRPMLQRADVALYRAKVDGRNRVVLCAEDFGGSEPQAPRPERHGMAPHEETRTVAPATCAADRCSRQVAH